MPVYAVYFLGEEEMVIAIVILIVIVIVIVMGFWEHVSRWLWVVALYIAPVAIYCLTRAICNVYEELIVS